MSLYTKVRSRHPQHRVHLGWSRQDRSYVVFAYDMTGMDIGIRPRTDNLIYDAGTADDPLHTVHDLVNATWSLVKWSVEADLLRRLALDPLIEDHEHRYRTSLAQNKQDNRPEVKELLERFLLQSQDLHLPGALDLDLRSSRTIDPRVATAPLPTRTR